MNDIAFKVIIKNDGIDDVIFKTIMLKGEKGDKGDAGGAQIDDSTTASNTTWSSQKINSEISSMPDNLSELEDVEFDTITDGQMVGYDLTSGKWKNKDADASSLKYDANTSIKDKIDEKANTADLSEVATSGDYDDLTNKPTIPPAQVNADWNASSGVAEILNKPTIPVVDTALDSSSGNAIANSAVKDALDAKANKTKNATFTPQSDVSVMHISSGYTDKQGCISAEIRFTGSANAWKTLGTLSIHPNDACQVVGIHTGTGAHLGIVRLRNTGVVEVYPIIAINNDAVGFSISFVLA